MTNKKFTQEEKKYVAMKILRYLLENQKRAKKAFRNGNRFLRIVGILKFFLVRCAGMREEDVNSKVLECLNGKFDQWFREATHLTNSNDSID